MRLQVRGFIEELLEEELEAALGRGRYERSSAGKGHRHGRRTRQLVTTFGPLELSVPRGRLRDATGEREWKSASLPAYKRLSHRAEALIAQAYLAGHEHPPGTPGAGQPVCRPCRQGRGDPVLAADPFGLGDVAGAISPARTSSG